MADRPSRHIVIAGAGIAGLTLALALAKHGMQVTVLERRDEIEEFGAGLQIGPNARRALNALNLDTAVSKVSFEPQAIDLLPFGCKQPLAALTLGSTATERYGVPYAVMHRGDLAELLHTACRRFANIDVRFGVSDFDVAVTDDIADRRRVTVSAKIDGDKPFKAHPFAFIGADGVGSRTRTALLGGPEATYSGYAAWRALIDSDRLKNVIDLTRSSLMFGNGFHAVAYPLHHRKTTNVALFTEEKLSLTFGIRTQPSLPSKVNSDPRLAAILSQAEWKHWPLATVNIASWHRGPIGLIGDAAHAMLPFQAQGAAMGIEDALILAGMLAHYETPDAAFAQFETVRRRRVKRVADTSLRNGQIFHMGAPLARARNMVMRAQGATSHFKRLDWLYSYNPLTESTPH